MSKDLTKLSTKELAELSGTAAEDLTEDQWWRQEEERLERLAG